MSYYNPTYDEPPRTRRRRYSCGGFASYNGPCGAEDCESCHPHYGYEDDPEDEEEHDVTTSRVVTARKARYVGTTSEIRPGDRVQVTSGFSYKKNGPRTGYLPKTYKRIFCGPNWTDEDIEEAKAKETWHWALDWRRIETH